MDPIGQFFASLVEPGRISTFEGESASLRFDIGSGSRRERWRVQVTDGEVAVTRASAPADAVVHIERPHLEAIVSGRLTSVAEIGTVLRAGTNCGSCIPELNAILNSAQAQTGTAV